MKPDRRAWVFIAIILAGAALLTWSLLSLYGTLEYDEDYAAEDYEELDENLEEDLGEENIEEELEPAAPSAKPGSPRGTKKP